MDMNASQGNGRRARGGYLLVLMIINILPSPLQALDMYRTAMGENIEENPRGIGDLLELRQAVMQLTQRFATLEVSLESRLSRLADTAMKGDVLLEALSSRLSKVDALVEKVDSLDSRLTQETSSLRATLRVTNRDLQTVASNLERLDNRVKGEDGTRHDVRSNWSSRTTSDFDLLTNLITERLGAYMDRTIPRVVNEALLAFQTTLTKHMTKTADELGQEWRQGREELENLGTQTLRKASETREELQVMTKKVYESFQEINDKLQTNHDDISYKIRMSTMPSIGELRPVLQQVNQSVAQSVARAAAGLNVTLREEAARRRGSDDTARADLPLHCPDPTTVAALQEVKYLLQSVLKKSEDLRRGLTKQTSEGVDLLKLLHQRFSVLLRRMNTEPDHGQQLVTEMQDLGALMESSYNAVLLAQNAFIDSCKRIQEEEPTLELKIAEILDKLVTDINLGHKFSRMQLEELKALVERLSDANANSGSFSRDDGGEQDGIQRDLRINQDYTVSSETSNKLSEVREAILETIESANLTVSRLETVQQRVDMVSDDLVETDWSNVRQKEPADQLVTAAKDLKGFARDQIIQSLNLHQALLTTLEQLTLIDPGLIDPHIDNQTTTAAPELDFTWLKPLNEQRYTPPSPQLILPGTCTAALLDQMRNLLELKNSITPAPSTQSTPELDEEENYEDEEDIPAWYTDPDFLSGNYGTPDKEFPVFREDEWRDMGDYANDDYLFIQSEATTDSSTTTTPQPTTAAPTTTMAITANTPRVLPGEADRYFGSKSTIQRKSRARKSVAYP